MLLSLFVKSKISYRSFFSQIVRWNEVSSESNSFNGGEQSHGTLSRLRAIHLARFNLVSLMRQHQCDPNTFGDILSKGENCQFKCNSTHFFFHVNFKHWSSFSVKMSFSGCIFLEHFLSQSYPTSNA